MTGLTGQLGKSAAAARLTPPARRLHRRVLTWFAETGLAPRHSELVRLAQQVAGPGGVDPQGLLAQLVDHDLVAVDGAGEIRAAYPFSPRPTAIRVRWDDGPVAYAMCAIDALGTSAMLDHPVTVTATEPDSGRHIVVEVDRDEATWHPATTVVYNGASGEDCCPSVDRTCGTINFFTAEAAATEWARRRPGVTGAVLDQPTALAAATAEFGPLL